MKTFHFILILFFIFSCGQKGSISPIEIKKLEYPSASSIEYIDGKLYLMGDDATHLLVLDTGLNIIDSIPIIANSAKRLPKETKPDLEASAFNIDSNEVFLFGSGSLSPYRNLGWKHKLKTKDNDSIDLEPLFLKVKDSGIEQINSEGACFVSGKLLLVNRGNKGYPHNHLIIIDEKFLKNDSSFQISIIPFAAQKHTTSFKGISGLCYARESDQLIMTVSTEDTKNSYEDGAIGNSYLWIISNISTKINKKALGDKRVIDLEYIDTRFKGQKIESATVIGERNDLVHLAMVADNDDGSSTVFKMSIRKTISLAE
ncbi:MAG TPA: hypothetical protein VFO37_14280 [Chitinophagaceae bacterium]|nr:hypothetical protein [Chitinophagaceae bacterium]